MPVTTLEDSSGRVHVHIDESTPLDFLTPFSQPVGNSGAMQEVLRVPLKLPPREGQNTFGTPVTRGQIVLGSSIAPPAGLTKNLTMEVALIGYVGAQGMVIDRGVLSATYTTRRFRLEAEEPFTALGIEARQLVDGAPDSSVIPPSFQVQLTGLFWS